MTIPQHRQNQKRVRVTSAEEQQHSGNDTTGVAKIKGCTSTKGDGLMATPMLRANMAGETDKQRCQN
eukprot:CAMPEP_0183713530 /NCGR_PEP_ID=MMETSP0737-20130205/8344_1 /TAXON_ID=385413 /ORGANISM="Thalassiosira miniscula, Strain CCMP1093" /LENGTH=66 /DNA_ID=CAMNT_0025942321 /DNA_START=676 /DNA_END=876 /DNA_ORIENTATION=+